MRPCKASVHPKRAFSPTLSRHVRGGLGDFRGFTLVELLVVIGLVSTLIAMLLPALNIARQEAKSVQCLSNLRQLALAAQAYVAQSKGYYPPAQYMEGLIWHSWDYTVNFGTGQITPGLLWMGQTDARIQQCPSFEGSSNTLNDPYTGYNYNTSYVGHGQGETIPAPAKATQIRHTERCALFGDGQYISGANKYMRAPLPNPADAGFSQRWSGTQGFRHRGRTNVVFADGHAESLRQRFTGGYSLPAGIGFLSADNSMYGG